VRTGESADTLRRHANKDSVSGITSGISASSDEDKGEKGSEYALSHMFGTVLDNVRGLRLLRGTREHEKLSV